MVVKNRNKSREPSNEERDMSDNTSTGTKSLLSTVLDFDIWLTESLAVAATKESSWGFLRPFMKLLEYSGDGLLWIPVAVIWNLLSHQMEMHHKLMNMLVVLIIDLIIVGSSKIIIRRKRPAHNQKDMLVTVAVDHFSFPSGHTTRAMSMALFITAHFDISCACVQYLVYAWPVLIASSRVMLGRHHVLDVLCGIAIGIGQYYLAVNYFWLSAETCEHFIRPIQEELHI